MSDIKQRAFTQHPRPGAGRWKWHAAWGALGPGPGSSPGAPTPAGTLWLVVQCAMCCGPLSGWWWGFSPLHREARLLLFPQLAHGALHEFPPVWACAYPPVLCGLVAKDTQRRRAATAHYTEAALLLFNRNFPRMRCATGTAGHDKKKSCKFEIGSCIAVVGQADPSRHALLCAFKQVSSYKIAVT